MEAKAMFKNTYLNVLNFLGFMYILFEFSPELTLYQDLSKLSDPCFLKHCQQGFKHHFCVLKIFECFEFVTLFLVFMSTKTTKI
jgi:hypothetical protein